MAESIYDQMNKWDKDDDFFVELIKKLNPKSIADLGCGTGRLTIFLANKGYKIVGIDPDIKSIETAKQKDESQLVTWKIGTSEDFCDSTFDLVMMTSNVVQVFINEVEWNKTLKNTYHSLNIGGYLIFDTRNPLQRTWESWTREQTQKDIIDPITGGHINVWHEYIEVIIPLVKYRTIYEYQNLQSTNEENVLIFRSKEKIIENLKIAGFDEINVFGDWKFEVAQETAKSYIFVAKKTAK